MSYFNHIWRLNRGFIIFSMIFISLFQLMLLYLVTTFDTQAMLKSILQQLPDSMKIFLNDSFFSMLSLDGAAAFGFNHPIVITMLAMIAIGIPVRHISKELENGNMEMMLSLPFTRKKLILKLWLSGLIILGITILASLLGSIISILIFHEIKLSLVWNLILICFNLYLLFILIMSYTMLFAVYSKGSNFSGNISAAITLFFYLLFFVAQIWSFLKPTLYANIFNYYQPQKIMLSKSIPYIDLAILFSLSLIMLFWSMQIFNKRDIP